MKKVILIDSSGIIYGAELARALSRYVDLYYVTRNNHLSIELTNIKRYYWFSSETSIGKWKKIIKGCHYIGAYLKVIRLIKREKIDIVHIQWLSVPKIDNIILWLIRRTGSKLIFTAHNILPHRNGKKYISYYRKHYSYFDRIIVHGEEIKKEFIKIFPEYSGKLRIERHGTFLSLDNKISKEDLDEKLMHKLRNSQKTAIFFGNMFFNKGIDALLGYWMNHYLDKNLFLIVVGKKDPDFNELNKLEDRIMSCSNIFYKPKIIEEVELNTYIYMADIVVMPYRSASMSGVIFKAAAMNKTVLTTDTGSIKEYILPEFSYLASGLDDFFRLFDILMLADNRDLLKKQGLQLSSFIKRKYDWNNIAEDTIDRVYNQ